MNQNNESSNSKDIAHNEQPATPPSQTVPDSQTSNASTSTPITNPPPVIYDPARRKILPAFVTGETNLARITPRPLCWVWQERLALSGITLLDGDHNCGKSLLALEIAVRAASGTPMLDGTPSLKAGVLIVAPSAYPALSQFSFLSSLPTDLSRIEVLSSVYDPETASDPSGYRPFSFPQDLSRLFEAANRINARLIILDPFIELLSRDRRWTEQDLNHFLRDFSMQLILHDLACLLIRNCPAKGGSARPSPLERSDCFHSASMSDLLIIHHPLQPDDHLLLIHARCRCAALAPTLILKVQGRTHGPVFPSLSAQGTHWLTAYDVFEKHPNILHRDLLCDHLLQIIQESTDPLSVPTLHARCPHSSLSQVRSILSALFDMGLIDQPARGFYVAAPANPVFHERAKRTRVTKAPPSSAY